MGFGWSDALDGIKGLAHAAGGLQDGLAHLGAEGLHAVGADSVATFVDGYGSTMNFVDSAFGDLAEPTLNLIPQVIGYDANFLGEGAQLFNDWVHGDPNAWSNFADAHVAMSEKAWGDFADGWTGAWKDITGPDSNRLFKELNQVDSRFADSWGDLGKQWEKLLTGQPMAIAGGLGGLGAGLGGLFGDALGGLGNAVGGALGGLGNALGLGGVGGAIGGIFSGGAAGGPVQQGMNRTAVQQLVEALRADRETLVRILEDSRHVVAQLGQAWHGRDAERYAADFTSQAHRIEQCAQALEEMAKSLTQQLQQQQSTSAV